MQKLIYISIHQFKNKDSDGVAKKILSQVKAMKNMGYSVTYTGINNENVFVANEYEVRENKLNRFMAKRTSVYKSTIKHIESEKFDIAYIRGLSCDIGFLRLLRRLQNKNIRILIEIPTYPREKATLKQNGLNGLILYYWDKVLQNYLYRVKIDRFLAIGSPAFRIFGKPAYNIYNGIDIEDYSIREYPLKDEVNVVAVAHVNIKHGYDRFIEGLHRYYLNSDGIRKKVYFHVVGSGFESLQSLVVKYDLCDYVKFHGVLSGEKLDAILNESQIALGALAIHRNNLWRGSVLKVKEYCARGIPFVVSYEEDKLAGELFCMQVSADETPIDIDRVVDFEKYCSENRNELVRRMREIVEKEFRWEIIYENHL